MKNITIGKYIPGTSVLHRMDARIKIVLTICFIAVLFMISSPAAYTLFCIGLVSLVFASGIKPVVFIQGLRPMLFIILFTAVVNLFFTAGEPIVQTGLFGVNIRITYEGIYSAARIFFRLVFLITGTSLLTLSTKPLSLADGIEDLLTPLKIIHVPAAEIALMMTIAIRFIPTLSEELDKIRLAQLARGADFYSSNLIKRAKAMLPLMIPLFVSAFKRADDLATAMDARCYNSGAKRTRMHKSKITAVDIKSCIVFALSAAVLFLV